MNRTGFRKDRLKKKRPLIKNRSGKILTRIFSAVLLLVVIAALFYIVPGFEKWYLSKKQPGEYEFDDNSPSYPTVIYSPGSITEHTDKDHIILNNDIPNFTEYDLTNISGENYSDLDRLGRCGTAVCMLDSSMMPKEDRGDIKNIKPSGYHSERYPGIIENEFLFNRCHLIAYSLTGQNDNERNLITGTDYMNTVSMLPFELRVLNCLYNHPYHILYRVTPFFKDNELVARGVELEALSVEDKGMTLSFHVFIYNYQPGIEIDYRTGDSRPLK